MPHIYLHIVRAGIAPHENRRGQAVNGRRERQLIGDMIADLDDVLRISSSLVRISQIEASEGKAYGQSESTIILNAAFPFRIFVIQTILQ